MWLERESSTSCLSSLVRFLPCSFNSSSLSLSLSVDHILFVQKDDVDFKMNENEIADTKWVSADELRAMFKEQEEGKIMISPWFHMIANQFLFKWWENLDTVMKTEPSEADKTTIHHLKLE